MGVFKDLLQALIRAGLYSLFSWMIRKGWVTQEQADSWVDPMVLKIVGVLGFVAVYLWSARDKFKSWLFGVLAREAPANESAQVIKRKIKSMPRSKAIKKVLNATAPTDGAKE